MSELEEIAQSLKRQEKNLEEILLFYREFVSGVQNPENWVDSLKVQEILGTSASTLYRRRRDGSLLGKRIAGRYFYFLPQVFEFRNHFLK